MRILNVTQSYYPFLDKGGPATKVRAITRALIHRGNQVTVLTADLGFGPREIAAAKVVGDPEGWRTDLDGGEVIYFRTRGHYRNLTVNPGVLRFCRRRLKEFDIVHVYGLYDTLGPAVGRYCRKFGVPYFVEPLGMTHPIDRGFFSRSSGGNCSAITCPARAKLSRLQRWRGRNCSRTALRRIEFCSDTTGSIARSFASFRRRAPFAKRRASVRMSVLSSFWDGSFRAKALIFLSRRCP